MYSTLSGLAVNLAPQLPGCPDNLILQQIRFAAREFFGKTEVWKYSQEDINIVADTATYDIDTGLDLTEVEIRRINWLKVSGQVIDPAQYYLLDGNTVQFYPNYVPSSSISEGLDLELVLVPWPTCDSVTELILDKHHEAIEAKAMERLLMMPGRPWSSPNTSRAFRKRYNELVNAAIKDRYAGYKSGSLQAWGHGWL